MKIETLKNLLYRAKLPGYRITFDERKHSALVSVVCPPWELSPFETLEEAKEIAEEMGNILKLQFFNIFVIDNLTCKKVLGAFNSLSQSMLKLQEKEKMSVMSLGNFSNQPFRDWSNRG